MILPLLLTFFALGAVVGSFLNVVIYRINTKKSLGGRSACMSCQSKLRFYELIPLISFLTLRGRCRTCKTKISVQYPSVELVTGVLFALLFMKFQDLFFNGTLLFTINYAYYAIIFSILVVIGVYDYKHKIIPDQLSMALAILSFLGIFFLNPEGILAFHFSIPPILLILSGLIISIPFAMMWVVSSGTWMGLGDAKLALGLGWLLGLASSVSAIALAFWIGAGISIVLVFASKKYKMNSEIPFAPYLILGALLVFLFNISVFSFGF